MQDHQLHKCDNEDCNICRGDLAYCIVCKGGEGSLPTLCPGRPMTDAEETEVYAGELDFIGGMWRRQ